MREGTFLNFLPPTVEGEPQKINDRFGTIVMSGVGTVLVDAEDRVLQPDRDVDGDRVLECLYGSPQRLVRKLNEAERMATEIFGEGPWRWVLHTTYHVTPGCES